jgi:hypothetical protein
MEDTLVKYTEEDLQDMVWDDHPDFETVVSESVIDTGRCYIRYVSIIKEKETGKFFSLSWAVGSTEQQECELDALLFEVVPQEVTKTIYVKVPF